MAHGRGRQIHRSTTELHTVKFHRKVQKEPSEMENCHFIDWFRQESSIHANSGDEVLMLPAKLPP